MDKRTHDYYDNHADKICERYNHISSPAPDWLVSWIPKGVRVRDVGAGSGRDVHALLAAGFDAYGIEPMAAMRRQVNKAFSEIMGR